MADTEGSTAAPKSMERDFVTAVLDTLREISKKNKKFRKLRDRRLAYQRGCRKLGARAERSYDRLRRDIVELLARIDLNGRRVDQLAIQLYEIDRLSTLGDIATAVAESGLPPRELRRLAAAVSDGELKAHRAIDAFMNYSQLLDGGWKYYRIGNDYLDTEKIGKAALRNAIDECQYWRGPAAAVYARREVYMAVTRCLTDALLLADAPRRAKLRDEHLLRRYPDLGNGAVLTITDTRLRIRIMCIKARAMQINGKRDCTEARLAHIAEGGFAEQIVAGRMKMRAALRECPMTWDAVAGWHDCLLRGTMQLTDIVDLRTTRDAHRLVNSGGGGDNR